MEYYGVMGIPTMILVGKDGKVVSLTARGEQLEKELEKLLGPAEEKKEATEGEGTKEEGEEGREEGGTFREIAATRPSVSQAKRIAGS